MNGTYNVGKSILFTHGYEARGGCTKTYDFAGVANVCSRFRATMLKLDVERLPSKKVYAYI